MQSRATALDRALPIRFLALLLVAVSLPLAGSVAQAQDENQTRRVRRAPDPEKLVGRAWWNQEKVYTELGLSEKQRAKADDQMRAFLAGRPERQQKSRDAQTAFAAALEAGGDAAAEVEQLKAASIASVTANAELRISVMKLLDADQRAKIKEKFPLLLRRSWANGGPRTPRIRRAQPKDQPPGR